MSHDELPFKISIETTDGGWAEIAAYAEIEGAIETCDALLALEFCTVLSGPEGPLYYLTEAHRADDKADADYRAEQERIARAVKGS